MAEKRALGGEERGERIGIGLPEDEDLALEIDLRDRLGFQLAGRLRGFRLCRRNLFGLGFRGRDGLAHAFAGAERGEARLGHGGGAEAHVGGEDGLSP